MTIITKQDAIKDGLTKYFTGIPCINNHISYRSTSNGKCSECRKSELLKNKDYRDKNKEKIAKKKKEYYHQNKEIISEKQKEYSSNNKDKIRDKRAKYYEENKDIVNQNKRINYNKKKLFYSEYNKKYRLSENGKFIRQILSLNRRALKKTTSDKTINKKSLKQLLIKQDNKCYYCNCELNFSIKGQSHIDHYIPLSKGGLHSINNVVWSCNTCNLKKNDKDATTFIKEIKNKTN